MIAFLKGILERVSENYVVIDVAGIGYMVNISSFTLANLPSLAKEVKIFTHMQVKEDGISLFGFLSNEELEMFSKLISVSGIGPKAAMSLLSSIPPSKLMLAIITEDIESLSKAQGIGKKTASRLVLELKDKIKTNSVIDSPITEGLNKGTFSSNVEKEDAINALITLGYGRSEAVRSVLEVALEGMSTKEIIKLALKKIAIF